MTIRKKYFKTLSGKRLPLPLFFPDATRGVIKTLDSADIENTKTPGILVNTYHLYYQLGRRVIKNHKGIGSFMSWNGGTISDSGGFQVMSLIKRGVVKGVIEDRGIVFKNTGKKKEIFSPEDSIKFQLELKTDLAVVLDDFTPPSADFDKAKETVERTILWAKKSKDEFEKLCRQRGLKKKDRPYLVAVVQGGKHLVLRKDCAQRLAEIGFDGYGFGGWPIKDDGRFDYDSAKVIADNTPKNSFLYGLGIGKPEEIVTCTKLGYQIFDCVLPTRDARHKRLYIFDADSIESIDINLPAGRQANTKFYSFYTPDKEKYYADRGPVSKACDCLLCSRYSRAYLAHLFRINEMTAGRLATIHNLRFYSILMEKIREQG
ncbi:MAG: tRNA guanosine(34) transglycosylase Tgt [Patescibacteria group bacterium]|nr:queuine tRNA-ribosyltransferase family protein [Patescibacteria group bacterium]